MALVLFLMPWLIGLSMLAVVGVLVSGIVTMARGASGSQRQGNLLMRWRVATQLFAVLLVALYLLLLQIQ